MNFNRILIVIVILILIKEYFKVHEKMNDDIIPDTLELNTNDNTKVDKNTHEYTHDDIEELLSNYNQICENNILGENEVNLINEMHNKFNSDINLDEIIKNDDLNSLNDKINGILCDILSIKNLDEKTKYNAIKYILNYKDEDEENKIPIMEEGDDEVNEIINIYQE
tara:strand:+ start:122 stop:622 length:501 start_codon:yes stop_codon:yes gene_type:complete